MNISESEQRNNGTTGPREQQLQECMLKWDTEAGSPDSSSGEPESQSIFHGLRSRGDERLEALWWYVTYPRKASPGRSQRSWEVVERIRRRYRRRLGARAKWREYVAERVGVNTQTVSAWRMGTQRPSPERKAKLVEICRELGRRGRSKSRNER
jgi:hypothetical protein